MKPSHLILIILAVAVVGGLVWWASARPTLVPVTPPAVNNLPTPPDQSTADWKTYSNTKIGFEFNYPPNFTILKSTDRELSNQDGFNISGPGLSGAITVNATYPNPPINLISSENIMVDGVQAKFDIYVVIYEQQISTNPSPFSSFKVTWITFKKGNNEFLLNLSYSLADDQTPLIKEILSTFRFTDPQ